MSHGERDVGGVAVRDVTGTRVRTSRVHTAIDLGLLTILAAVLLDVFLRPLWSHGYPFPVGPDVPVYLWWSRVGAGAGISLVGERPGTPALIPTVGAALDVGLVPAIAGLQYALGPAIGTCAAALLRGRGAGPRPAWLAGGLLAGLWATHLGTGYLANLVFVTSYLAAAVALGRRTTRGAVAAALLLGGGGLAHPQFFLVGLVVLLVAAGWSALLEHRFTWASDAGRTFGALLGGAAIVAAGVLVASIGPAVIGGDTSKDGLLRRLGQWSALRRTYLSRLWDNWHRYAPFVSPPLAALGMLQGRGFMRRFLIAWTACTVVALPIGVLTGWFPPDRMLTFAFCIPMLAGLGIAWLGRRVGRWWLAWPVGIALIALMAWPAVRSWDDQGTFLSPDELRDATIAGRVAASTDPGTVLVYVADDPTTPGLFLASHTLNVARATVPPDRVADVRVYLGTVEDLLAGRAAHRPERLYGLASEATLQTVPRDRPMAVFVVREFDKDPHALADLALSRWDVGVASSVPGPRALPALPGEPAPSTPTDMAHAAIRTLALLMVIGLGWAWWALGDAASAAAIAPAFGVATLTAVAFAMERLGVPLGTGGQATVAAALAGGSGYCLLTLRVLRQRQHLRRRALVVESEPVRETRPEISNHPDQ
jgi:hypothetical protein